MLRRRLRHGITRTEVVVLVLLAVLLAALAVPAILQARAAARAARCADNLKQIALGLLNYGEAYRKTFPDGTIINDRLPPQKRWSWYVGTWEFVVEPQSELLVDLDRAWDAPGNRPVRFEFPTSKPPEKKEIIALPMVRCPANPIYQDPKQQDANSYVGMAGTGTDAARLPGGDPKDGIWGYGRQTHYDQITDGLKYTILLAETGLDCGPWMAGGTPTVRGLDTSPSAAACVGPGGQFGGLHAGGANVAMADGSGRTISNQVDPEVFSLQIGIADAPHSSRVAP